MAEYIEREAAIKSLLNDSPEQAGYSREDAADCIRYMDAADVAPVRHGRWVGDSFCKWQCNKCRAPAPKYGYPVSEFIRSSYCPNCGADMRGSNDE